MQLPKSYRAMKESLTDLYKAKKTLIMNAITSLKFRPSMTCDVWTDEHLNNAYIGLQNLLITFDYADI